METKSSDTSKNDNLMDDKLARQLVRQLKIINFWISFYGIIMIAIMGFLLYMIIQMVMFVQDTNKRIEQIRTDAADSLNVQKKSCGDGSPLADWLKNNTDICK